jgi:hypothetical protein
MTLPTDEELRAVGEWLGFSASVIKSGEPWTPTCDERYQKARRGLTDLLNRLARTTDERDEADRRAGSAERQLADEKDTSSKRGFWLYRAKEDRGYDQNVSFDVVWADTCALADRTEAAESLAQSEKARAGRLADALRFYGAEGSWDRKRKGDPREDLPTAIELDQGRRARAALTHQPEENR